MGKLIIKVVAIILVIRVADVIIHNAAARNKKGN